MQLERKFTDLVGVVIRGSNLNCSRQIENDFLIFACPRSPPSLLHRLTHLQSKLRLGLCKRLWTILVLELRSVLRRTLIGQLANEFCVLDGEGDGFFFVVPEDNITETGASRIVHVDDGLLGSGYRLYCASDEVFSGRSQDLSSVFS